MVHLQGKSPFLGIVLALVSHKLPLNGFEELLLRELLRITRTLLWWADHSFELMQVLQAGNREIGKVSRLEEIVDDADFLRIVDCEPLTRVDSHGIVESPVLPPDAVHNLLGMFYGHLDDGIEDELFPTLRRNVITIAGL